MVYEMHVIFLMIFIYYTNIITLTRSRLLRLPILHAILCFVDYDLIKKYRHELG